VEINNKTKLYILGVLLKCPCINQATGLLLADEPCYIFNCCRLLSSLSVDNDGRCGAALYNCHLNICIPDAFVILTA